MNLADRVSDLRLALRSLRRQKTFTAAALLSLGLGIGANTALFSVVYGVLLRPMPYADADRVVRLSEYHQGATAGFSGAFLSNFTYFAWENAKTIEGIGVFRGAEFIDTTAAEPVRVEGSSLSPATFGLLGARPALGRLFVDSDGIENAPAVAVISHAFWRERFGSDPGVIGKSLILNGRPRAVIGVTEPEFYFPDRDARIWTVEGVRPGSADPRRQGISLFGAIAKLRPGVAPEVAAEEATIAARSVKRPPVAEALFGEGGRVAVRVEPLLSHVTGKIRPALLAFAAGSGFILLIACANVASLQLTRGLARQREIAVRTALGASRAQITQQLFGESALLALGGGVIGIALGAALLGILPRIAPADFPRIDDIALNGYSLLFAIAASAVAGLLSGLWPSFRSAASDLVPALRDGSGASSNRSTQRARSVLVAAEAALAVVLLVGAGLLAHSFTELLRVDPGYVAGNVLIASLELSEKDRPAEVGAARAAELLARVRAMPGVESAGIGNMIPLDNNTAIRSFDLPSANAPGGTIQARATAYTVTPGYHEALSIGLEEGRYFAAADEAAPIETVIVNEEFVKLYLRDGRPVVGRRLTGLSRNDGTETEIIGVVRNVLKNGLDDKPLSEMYALRRAGGSASTYYKMVVRTADDPSALAPQVRALVRAVEPTATLETVALSQRVAESVAQPRFAAMAFTSFALLALTLAAAGLYGALSYSVSQRTRELGVRSALGATRRHIVSLIVRQGLTIVGAGVIAGVMAASYLARFLESLLFGVKPFDPLSFAVAPVALLVAAFFACLVPARRGASVAPTEALRCE